jgi:hypothetical protein
MKTITKIGWIASLCILGFSSRAQINEFYHINGHYPADHGVGDKVILTQPSELDLPRHYVVAGATRSSEERSIPSVSLSAYALDGYPLWHSTFVLNSPDEKDITSVNGLVERTRYARGFGLLAHTNSDPAQSVLIRTDERGIKIWQTELGEHPAASLAYDSDLDRFLVLKAIGEGSKADLQLIVVDAKSGAVLHVRTYDGYHESVDMPVRVLYDDVRSNYLLVGNSTVKTDDGSVDKIMVVRVAHDMTHIYTRTLGRVGLALSAVDATILPAGFNSQLAIAGQVSGIEGERVYRDQSQYTTVDIRTGKLADVHALSKKTGLKAIGYEPASGELELVGNIFHANDTEADLIALDPTDPAAITQNHVYNKPGSIFVFNDIAPALSNSMVMTGYHNYPASWHDSPGGLRYNWLSTADNNGIGACETEDLGSAVTFDIPHKSSKEVGRAFFSAPIKISEERQEEIGLNGCDLDFRMTKPTAAAEQQFRMYPNPATELLQIEYNTGSSEDHVDLILTDITGRIVLSQQLPSNGSGNATLNVAGLATGVYYSDFRVNGQSMYKNKIAVTH